MKVYKDKATGNWKIGPNTPAIYETKEQAQRASLDLLTDRLAAVRKRIKEGILGYGK